MTPSVITLLYVDDEEMNLFLFEKSFETDYKIITALSGEEGLEKLEKKSDEIIVVISDMRMPGMSGIEFIKKARENYTRIAYFILTGFEYSDEIDAALKAGEIQQFFTKPFDIDQIRGAIQKAVERL